MASSCGRGLAILRDVGVGAALGQIDDAASQMLRSVVLHLENPRDWVARTGQMSAAAKRILIVDNDTEVVEFLTNYFDDSGQDYTVETTSNGIDGLEAVHRQRPDLILLDISPPDLNGVDVLKLIHQRAARIPVIMIIGARDTRAAGEAMEHGAFACVPTPLSVPYIDSLVTAALRIR